MSFITEHKQKFDDLKSHLRNKDQIRRGANGGNSILFSYPPHEEELYLEKAKEIFPRVAYFIDISNLLVEFIDQDGWEDFSEYYRDFITTPHKVFKSDDPSEDLFDLIINQIEEANKLEKIPFLIRTGCLFGTGVENINIIEHKIVMALSNPLVIFYPSTFKDENLYFLGFKKASKYRCVLVK